MNNLSWANLVEIHELVAIGLPSRLAGLAIYLSLVADSADSDGALNRFRNPIPGIY